MGRGSAGIQNMNDGNQRVATYECPNRADEVDVMAYDLMLTHVLTQLE